MLNYGGCTLKTLGVVIVYDEYLFINSSYSKKKNQFLTLILISSMVESKQQNRSKKRESKRKIESE